MPFQLEYIDLCFGIAVVDYMYRVYESLILPGFLGFVMHVDFCYFKTVKKYIKFQIQNP